MIDNTRWITLYLSLWFSCPRFSRVYHARWRVRHLLPKCVIAHISWRGLHLLPKWRPTRAHKKSRTQFWLSDSSGIIYHLWSKEDCGTDCSCCFCLSILKRYNAPQLCSRRLNKRFLPPKMADYFWWYVILQDLRKCKTYYNCRIGYKIVLHNLVL
jgi:hypothetical protein